MAKVVDKVVEFELSGLNGNAMNLMGAFGSAAKRQGWTRAEVDLVQEECMAGDYDHVLQTLMAHTETPHA